MKKINALRSFKYYFEDIKPYHTKILEILYGLPIREDLYVKIEERLNFSGRITNTLHCSSIHTDGVEDYYNRMFYSNYRSNLECDVYETFGGYGLIFDNSDELISYFVDDFNLNEKYIGISENATEDWYFQIKSIETDEGGIKYFKVSGDPFILNADASPRIDSFFFVVPEKTFTIKNYVSNGFWIKENGDFSSYFKKNLEFRIINYSSTNNAKGYDFYTIKRATYDQTQNRTFVEVELPHGESFTNEAPGWACAVIKTDTKNNGIYEVDKENTYYDHDENVTLIAIKNRTNIKLPNEVDHGTIILRRGLKPGRRIFIEYSDGSESYKQVETIIVRSTFDGYKSRIYLNTPLLDGVNNIDTVKLIGYFTGAGFDGFEEQHIPGTSKVLTSIYEKLKIGSIEDIFSGGSGGPTSSPYLLSKGIPVGGLNAPTNSGLYFMINVPTNNYDELKISTTGGNGDVDIYVKYGSIPSDYNYDYYSTNGGNNDEVTITSPMAGTYYIYLYAYQTFNNVTILADYYNALPIQIIDLEDGVTISNINYDPSVINQYRIYVPSGSTKLLINTTGGSGDVDIYVKYNNYASTSNYSYSSTLTGNQETVTINNPYSGYWYIYLQPKNGGTYSNVSLTANISPVVIDITDGIPITGINYDPSIDTQYRIYVPYNVYQLEVTTSGGSGDVDVYLRYYQYASPYYSNGSSTSIGNNEQVVINTPTEGDWYIYLSPKNNGTYSNVTLSANLIIPNVIELTNGVTLSGIDDQG